MWIHRILVLLLLQRVLGHTLSRYEPQESEVYELRQDKDTNTVQFVYPKSSVPKLREIIYYHIIEKTPAEETPKELTSESETERQPTNTHGYQFLDSLLVDYDTATQETKNPPEELEYGNDEDGNVYKAPMADDSQYEENPANYPTDDAEAYEVVEEPAKTDEQQDPVEAAEPEEGTVQDDETNSDVVDDNVEADAAADGTEAELEETVASTDESDDGTDESEDGTNVSEDGLDMVEDDTIESKTDTDITEDNKDELSADYTADVAAETTEPMAVEAPEISEDEELAIDDVLKSLEARNQLFGSPELLRERMMKVRNYLPHLHPRNSHFEPEVVGSKRRRRRRRSVQEKRNARSRRSVLYIFPQGRSLSEPYDESNIPQAPTLSPMDTEGLPSFIKSEMNPENNANSELDPEAPETVPEDTAFVPPPNTYGVKLDNGDGYVWNTLYGSASSEPGAAGGEVFTTPYSEPYAEDTPDVPKLEEETTEEPALEEVPSDLEIPEESLVDVPNEETGEENTEDSYAGEPEQSFDEAGEIPVEEGTDDNEGDSENVEVSLPEDIEQITIMEELPAEEITTVNPQDDLDQRLADIFDSIRDFVKKGDQALTHKEIESGIHDYLEAEKDMLARDPDALAITETDVLEEEEQQDKLVGADDIAQVTSDVEDGPVLPEQHGTYGFRLIGDQGEVWNDFTGVRYHVGQDEPTSNDFDNLDTGFDNFKEPEGATKPIIEPYDANIDANSEFDNLEETSDENFTSENNLGLNNDIFSKIIENLKNLTQQTIDKQVSTALPESSGPLERPSIFLSLLEDENYRHWIQEWTLEYTRFLAEYINDTFHAAIAERKEEVTEKQMEEAREEGLEEENITARLYINDEELKQSPEVKTIINSISDKYLRRRRKHCKKPESTAEVTADNIYGGSLNSGKVVNVFVFFTEEQGKEILDFIKPESTDEVTDSESPDTSDEDYKPDESELEDGESEEDSEPTEIDVGFLQTEAPNVEEGEIETDEEPIDVINEEILEPVEITTELSASDFEYTPEENPEEPQIVEEPEIAEELEPFEGEETSSESTEAAEEPILDKEITDEIPAEETTGSDIEESTSEFESKTIGTDEVLAVLEEAEDEEPVQESELSKEESAIDEIVEATESIEGEDVVEVTEPVEDEGVKASEPTEENEEIETAEPIEEKVEESEPIPEEVEEHIDEDAEPTEQAVIDEPIDEEAVDKTEPIQEEEDSEHTEQAETESPPLEDAVDRSEPATKDVEAAVPLVEKVVDDDPLEGQEEVTDPTDDVKEAESEPEEQAKVVSELLAEE